MNPVFSVVNELETMTLYSRKVWSWDRTFSVIGSNICLVSKPPHIILISKHSFTPKHLRRKHIFINFLILLHNFVQIHYYAVKCTLQTWNHLIFQSYVKVNGILIFEILLRYTYIKLYYSFKWLSTMHHGY